MSGTHHRTWQQYHVGHLNITVQLKPPAEGPNSERQRELDTITRQLTTTLDAERVPATWAVSEPARSGAISQILLSVVGMRNVEKGPTD